MNKNRNELLLEQIKAILTKGNKLRTSFRKIGYPPGGVYDEREIITTPFLFPS
ncbi:MAG: hypothetical protein BAJALOKI1v1_1100015 [Promethearchaeota archaeon]|nr:MAG: hypothetical protein BAJALOKI1v1_1100015 [Candidatus Lokiarchaeota archaeon]